MWSRAKRALASFAVLSCCAATLSAQAVPTDAAGVAHIKAVTRPRASLSGASLDSALIGAERIKWALGNVGRYADAQPYFSQGFLNIGAEPTGVRRLNKSESYALLQSLKVPPMPIEIGDWTVVRAGRDARLVNYALRAMGMRMWVSSLWERQPSGWATVFYQLTPDVPMPALPTAPK